MGIRLVAGWLLLALVGCAGSANPRHQGRSPESCGESFAATVELRDAGYLGRALARVEESERTCSGPQLKRAKAQLLAALWLNERAISAYERYGRRGGAAAAEARTQIAQLRARPRNAGKADASNAKEAVDLFRAAVKARLVEKQPDEALRLLRKSYAAAPHPLTIVEMGQAHKAAGRDVDYRKMNARALAIASETRGPATMRVLTGHTARVRTVAYHPNGTIAASGGADGSVKLWDLGTQKVVTELDAGGHVRALDFNHDGTQLAAASGTEIKVWNTRTGALLRVLRGHVAPVVAIAFHPTQAQLASLAFNEISSLRVWDVTTGKLIGRSLYPDKALAIEYSPDGTWLAESGYYRGVTRSRIQKSGERRVRLDRKWGSNMVGDSEKTMRFASALAFKPDGTQLAVGSESGVYVFDVASGRRVMTLDGAYVSDVAYSWDGNQLAATSGHPLDPELPYITAKDMARRPRRGTPPNGGLQVWDASSGKRLYARTWAGENADALAFHPHTHELIIAVGRGLVQFDTDKGQKIRDIGNRGSTIRSLSYAPNGARLA